MVLKIAERVAELPAFIVMEVLRAAQQRQSSHGDVLHLEIGQPATGAPEAALREGQRRMLADPLGYSLALGTDSLRERIARHILETYDLAILPEQIVVTTGSSGAFLLAFLTAFAPGDRVGVAAPSYPAYRNILRALGIEPILLPVGPDSHFQIDLPLLFRSGTRDLDGLIVASPSNPTGSMLAGDDLRALADFCAAQGIRFISDEIYHGITYGRTPVSVAGRPGAIVINSFSKYFSMTGWRLGWMVLPIDMVRPIEKLAQNLFIAPPSLAQHVAEAVFEARAELDANITRYRCNRDILLNELPAAGFADLAPADGAFYLYADVRRWSDDSVDFCRRMLDQIGVAITPGLDFDPLAGKGFVRFSFSGDSATMIDAMKRLRAWKK